ncbi:MAG: response regulator transcription factor [Bacteroidota bacterium]|nr:response regulator transcription factor [Bacteroidota bacterium]
MKILLVEDEINLCEAIASFLEEEGYRCEKTGNLKLAIEKVYLYEYDCVLIDIGLPDGNGLTLVRDLKKIHPETGIIIISAKNSLDDKITGLDLGADDYLTKPFHFPELNSRIKSLIRRRKFEGKKEIIAGKIRIIPDNRQVYIDNNQIILTRKEYDLLLFFISNQERILTKESIAEHLWGDFADTADSFDFIYSHIKNLRRKLQHYSGIDYFQNIYGTGYSFTLNK